MFHTPFSAASAALYGSAAASAIEGAGGRGATKEPEQTPEERFQEEPAEPLEEGPSAAAPAPTRKGHKIANLTIDGRPVRRKASGK
eukprot:5886731-Alexandrium_andersonii.AAC.1